MDTATTKTQTPTINIDGPAPTSGTVSNLPQGEERNWAWMWLAYTGFLLIVPIFEPSLRMWLATLTVLAVFVVIFAAYVRAQTLRPSIRAWLILATFVLGIVTWPWNTGGSTFFVYTASFLPFSIISVRRVVLLFGLESLLVVVEWYIFRAATPPFHIYWPNTIMAVMLLLIIGGGNILAAQQKRAACKLRAAQEENLALAALAERERIARDLHDVLGHTLSVIVLKAELAGRLIERDPARAAAEIGDVERTARTALAEVREAIGGYRARGLAAEIEAARRTLDAAGVTLLADSTPGSTAGLSAAEETVLALALREAVTNIVRHARATTCRLRFVAEEGRRRLVVEDDGQHPAPREGNGLRGMRERVESLGGRLLLERGTGASGSEETGTGNSAAAGTRLSIDLPLRAGAAAL